MAGLLRRLRDALPADVDFCSIRVVDERNETLTVRADVLQPVVMRRDVGAMVTVHHGGGLGYAATTDLGPAGLAAAVARARTWAARTAERAVFDPRSVVMAAPRGSYATPVGESWDDQPMGDRLDRIRRVCAAMNVSERIVDRSASVSSTRAETWYVTTSGAEVHQDLRMLSPDIYAAAHANGDTQLRSMGSGRGASQQGGAEVLDRCGFDVEAPRIAREALELLDAPDCPTGTMDLVLAPDQMILQIHESIGHPIELDRILGDERNYAGTSFVTLDMFGSYRYGSDLLNVTFDPTVSEEFASYAYDDDGAAAERVDIIRHGLLVRPLGGTVSQARAGGIAGTANARAESWHRPAIDRMANLNVEPGDSSVDDLIGGIERGVYMAANSSWSIDDSRNKFQFGCEFGRTIEDGQLGGIVKNPNYRGISATFWRALSGVGDASTRQVLGTPYCGKGEPNQIIRVGHASPVCRFSGIDVFGGE